MQAQGNAKPCLKISMVAGLLFFCTIPARAQEARRAPASSSSADSETVAEVRTLADLVRDLQVQVQTLNGQIK